MREIISITAPEGLDTEEVTYAKELVLNELMWPKNDTMVEEGDEESSIIHDQIGFADLVVTRLIESGWRPTHEINASWLAYHDSEVASKTLKKFADSIDVEALADTWSDAPGNRDGMHWAAENTAKAVAFMAWDKAKAFKKMGEQG